jgi:hypothetical protein
MKPVLSLLLCILIVSCEEQVTIAPENQLYVIAPYYKNGTWVFDDEKKGLLEEPFVSGVPQIIDRLSSDIPEARKGFRLVFSANEFPDFELKAIRGRPDGGGYWYSIEGTDQEGWLCPALLRYYKTAPETIYAKADPLQNE